jgi:hypothetical protein
MSELRGVVHGNVIELQEKLGLPDGEQVSVIVRPLLPRGEGIRRSAGAWADANEDWDAWLEGIRRDREDAKQ